MADLSGFDEVVIQDTSRNNVTVTDNCLDVNARSAKGTLTDRSGVTSSTPSTSTTLMAANASRRYLLIQNMDNNNIWINFTSAATTGRPSIEISPGGSFVMEGSFVSTEAVNVIATAPSQDYTAKEA